MKFLVVDDDPAILKLLTEILVGFGHEDVVQAQSGDQALQILQAPHEPFDCLMLDIQMPEMDGIELCRAVRQLPDYEDTTILMITAMRDEAHISRAFAAGATDYTTKPFDVQELMERINVAEAATTSPETPQDPPPQPRLVLNPAQMDGVISRPALNNYARILMKNPSVSLAASVIEVTGLEDAAVLASDQGSGCIVRRTVDVIHDTLLGAHACMTYLGDDSFLCVCSQSGSLDDAAIQQQLDSAVVRLRRDAMLPESFLVAIGTWAQPRVFDRGNTLKFMDRAIAAGHMGQASNLQREPNALTRRLRAMF